MLAVEAVTPPEPELLGHAEHFEAPKAALNVSAAHAVGVPPSSPVYPAVATQALITIEPVAASVPELFGQSEHAAAPMAALKVSAAHAVKLPPSGPVYPIVATQAVEPVAPLALAELLGHT